MQIVINLDHAVNGFEAQEMVDSFNKEPWVSQAYVETGCRRPSGCMHKAGGLLACSSSVAPREDLIPFNDELIPGIMERRKTMTRRIIKMDPPLGPDIKCVTEHSDGSFIFWAVYPSRDFAQTAYPSGGGVRCPYGQSGDILLAQESWRVDVLYDELETQDIPEGTIVEYAVLMSGNGQRRLAAPGKWREAKFMPRWACRTRLKITDIRAEKLQSITEEDIIQEGIVPDGRPNTRSINTFIRFWNSLYPVANNWQSNPWVWVIEFKMVE